MATLNRRKARYGMWIVAGIAAFGLALWGPLMSRVEQAKYEVASSHGNIEIRDYAPQIIAEVTVRGNRDDSANEGFRQIADYIFGNNQAQQSVAMTAPVQQQASEKIAMTAPVLQQPEQLASAAESPPEEKRWQVRFVMPSAYSLETLPKPNNPKVTLREVPASRYAAIRFAGTSSAENLQQHRQELEAFLKEKNLTALSVPTYAFYNPPWTLPFLRRNEVLIEITSAGEN